MAAKTALYLVSRAFMPIASTTAGIVSPASPRLAVTGIAAVLASVAQW